MARLYVANSTKQKIEFHFRVPENDKVIMLSIGIGRQEPIPLDLNPTQMEVVVRQLEASWGAVPAINIDRAKHFVGVCYGIDKPVTSTLIERAVGHNLNVLDLRGKEFRKETAVAINEASDFGANGKNTLLETETIIREIPERGGSIDVDERITVSPRGTERPTGRGRRKAA